MRKFQRTAVYSTLLLCCFVIGAICGCALAALGQPSSALQNLLNDHFLLIAGKELSISVFAVFLRCIQWPIFVVFAFYLPCSAVSIPFILALRGLSLSYAVTCLCMFFDYSGLTTAAALFSVLLIFEIPALFIVSCDAFAKSVFSGVDDKKQLSTDTLLTVGGFLLVAIALHLTAMPGVFSAVCMRLFL